MHMTYNGAFSSQKVQICKSALLQFRQYSEAVTQCLTAAEKCPLHTQLKQCILCIIERLLVAGINLSMQKKHVKVTKTIHVTYAIPPICFKAVYSTGNGWQLILYTLHNRKLNTPHCSVTIAKITLMKLGIHSVHMPIQLNFDCICRCNTRMWNNLGKL